MTLTARKIKSRLKKLADKKTAQILQGFFKTGKGEYGEGDIFLGIRVPILRKLLKEYRHTPETEVIKLLHSPIHEERMLAILILVDTFTKGDEKKKNSIYRLYLNNTESINNWDLVDISAGHIVGAYLINRSRKILYRLAGSDMLWERRIAIVATFNFIRHNDFSDTLKISEMLLSDKEDLIHKAVGWMLREVGKRDFTAEEKFLKRYYKKMPRTMLRYAIEKFPERKRQKYLKGKI